jgi:hypothetical protein
MLYNKLFINLACMLDLYREISDLDLFVQTSVRYFSVQTSRSVNKKSLYYPFIIFIFTTSTSSSNS